MEKREGGKEGIEERKEGKKLWERESIRERGAGILLSPYHDSGVL